MHALATARAIFAIALSLWLVGLRADPVDQSAPEPSRRSFEFAGLTRNYTLFVPASAAASRGRIYLFGNSGGAVYSLLLAMVESQTFAAVAVHAGAWRAPSEFRAVSYAQRKVPIAVFIGDKDEFFPLFTVRKTSSALEKAGHTVSVTVMRGHTHSYADVAAEVNRNAWDFMKAHRL